MPNVEPQVIQAFASDKQFAKWLKVNHDKQTEVYLRIYKKDSGVATVSYAQALDVALCWGWIDGVRKAYDEQPFLQRFSPRKARSVWSQINRGHVARLIAERRMTVHGLKQVEAAKADGRWDAAYAPASTMTIPADLEAAVRDNPRALRTFETLNKQNLYALSFRLGNLKTPAGRARRIVSFVELLARGETLRASGKQTEAEE